MSRLLIIGDAMVDIYCHGTASRISPEAPIPIVINYSTAPHIIKSF
tara:strand:+ start:381 stop:518 length:138 start_codon:yes stop_codon:yes gene_type:complete